MKKELKYLVIHCTATPEGRNISSNQIINWHCSKPPIGRGWKQVGYSSMFHLNGTEEVLVKTNDDNFVDNWEITNGVKGINSISRHIVYVGGVNKDFNPKDTRTKEQKKSMETFVKHFVLLHPNVLICGHYQFSAKACPSFDVRKWCEKIGIPEKNIK